MWKFHLNKREFLSYKWGVPHLAGYPDPMIEMLNDNPGLKSRFPNMYHFDDYTVDELMLIAESYLYNNNYSITDEAKSALRHIVKNAYNLRDNKFGNGRYVTSLLENEVIPNLASRLISMNALEQTGRLSIIEKNDVPLLQTTVTSISAMIMTWHSKE